MTAHNHPGDRLEFGCGACLDQVHREQRRARWMAMSDDDLLDVWAVDHERLTDGDEEFVGLLCVERGLIDFEAFCDVVGIHVSEEAS